MILFWGMDMVLREVTNIKEIEQLNTEAFPVEERIPICDLARMAKEGNYALLEAYEAAHFVGFAFLAVNKPSVYLFLLAVNPQLRSKGYGGKIVKSICEFYPDCQVVVDIQRVDELCDNLQQRRKRREFYLRNGFYPTSSYLLFNGMEFDILCSKPFLDKDSFNSVLSQMQANGFSLGMR